MKPVKEPFHGPDGTKVTQTTALKHCTQYRIVERKMLWNRSRDRLVVGMEHEERLAFHGVLTLRLYQGAIEMHGAKLSFGRYHRAYSPKWSSALVLSAKTSPEDCLYSTHFRAGFDETQGCDADDDEQQNIEKEKQVDRMAQEMATKYPVVVILKTYTPGYDGIDCFAGMNEKYFVGTGWTFILDDDAHRSIFDFQGKHLHLQSQQDHPKHDEESIETTMCVMATSVSSRVMSFPNSWTDVAHKIVADTENSFTSTLVCGAKSVGKSTFCRFLVNQMLCMEHVQAVAFLDTDIGQPEFTPPGMLSLHIVTSPLLGPAHTHMAMPYRSYYFGHVNPKADPTGYVEMVRHLCDFFRSKFRHNNNIDDSVENSFLEQGILRDIPLVINTDGWIKSMGHNLLSDIIEYAAPSHIIQLQGTSKARSFDIPISGPWQIYPVTMWDTNPPLPNRNSKELRQYRHRSYFLADQKLCFPMKETTYSQLFTDHGRGLSELISHTVSSLTPYEVPFHSIAVSMLGGMVPPSQLLYVFNASIVGLCVDDFSTYHNMAGKQEFAPSPPVLLPKILLEMDSRSVCVGLGIIRSIDRIRGVFHLLTPVPKHVLKFVNVLVKGSICLPLEFQFQNTSKTIMPYCNTNIIKSEGTGSQTIQSRNNLKRKKDDF